MQLCIYAQEEIWSELSLFQLLEPGPQEMALLAASTLLLAFTWQSLFDDAGACLCSVLGGMVKRNKQTKKRQTHLHTLQLIFLQSETKPFPIHTDLVPWELRNHSQNSIAKKESQYA